MTVTFVLGTLEFISANFINPYTGELLEVEGSYYINDTPVDGGGGTADILLGSTHNQFFSLESETGEVLLVDLEVFLMAAGDDILNLTSSTVMLGDVEIQLAEGNDIVWANVGNDIIGGSLGDDILNGGPGNDTLSGDEDSDTLIGWTGNDTLDGGTGNDTLDGGAGDDVYVLSPGDGYDILTETSGFDTLLFTDSILLSDLTMTQTGMDLQIDVNLSGVVSGVTIVDFYAGNPDLVVEMAEFDDGSTFDLTSLLTPPDLGEPDAVNDTVNFNASDGMYVGDVMANDVASPDGGTALTQIMFGALVVAIPTDGSDVSINGDNGVLTINNLGEYSYDPFDLSPAILSAIDHFDYVLSDIDGDTDSATLAITTLNDTADTIIGTTGNDTVFGGLGDDVLDGNTGSDLLSGGDGNDTLIYSNDAVWPSGFVAWNVGAPDAIIDGDRITVAPRYRSFDNFEGGDGTDTIQMGDDGEALFLDDRYSGNPTGHNTARLSGVEIIHAGGGDDIVDLTSKQFTYGDVSLYGEGGNDVLWGNAGNDYISGGIGNDHLDGASGNDVLNGGDGNDTMYGWSGDDTFIIGSGADNVYSGSGMDHIVYDMIDSLVDYIHDFAGGDTLDLSDVLVGYDALTDAIGDFVSVAESSGNTVISVDADGGGDNFVQIAALNSVTGLGDAQDMETSGALITM